MKKIALLAVLIIAMSCQKETPNFTLKGNIKGFKKGIVFLQKIEDSTFVTLDSLIINGNPQFELQAHLESPEMLFLKLNKNDHEDAIVDFFAEPGVTEINSTVKNFVQDLKIHGSAQQKLLEDFEHTISRFNDQNLDFIKENLEAQKDNDSTRINSSVKNFDNLIKRKYLYTVNFAINHKDSEIAPYLALTQIYDANIKYLDTINKILTPKVKASKYGKELQAFIEKRKQE